MFFAELVLPIVKEQGNALVKFFENRYRLSIFIWQVFMTAGVFIGIQSLAPILASILGHNLAMKLFSLRWGSSLLATTILAYWLNHHRTIDFSLKMSSVGYFLSFISFFLFVKTHSLAFILLYLTIFSLIANGSGVARNEAYIAAGLTHYHLNIFFNIGMVLGIITTIIIPFPYTILVAAIYAVFSLFFPFPKISVHQQVESHDGEKNQIYLLLIAVVVIVSVLTQKIALTGFRSYKELSIVAIAMLISQLIANRYNKLWIIYPIIWIVLVGYEIVTRTPNLYIFYALSSLSGVIISRIAFWGRWKGVINATSVRNFVSFILWLL